MQRRRYSKLPTLLVALVLLVLCGAYIGTTIELFSRSRSAHHANEALSMKVDMLQTELDTIDLSMVPAESVTLLENGTCVMNDDFGPPAQGLIDYRYYAYTIGNLTRYFVEFDGGIDSIAGGSISSDPGCAGGVKTSRYRVNIFGCLKDPARDSGVPSLVNQGFPGQSNLVHQSFSAMELAKIDFGGATDTIITNSFFPMGTCTPRLYTVTSGGDLSVLTTGPQYETLLVTWWAWTAASGPFSVTLNNVRVPIPQSFSL